MSTEFYNRNWRMPKSSNSSKVSNYSMQFNGSSEYIDLGTSIPPRFSSTGNGNTEPWAVSLWANFTTGSSQALIQFPYGVGVRAWTLFHQGTTAKIVFGHRDGVALCTETNSTAIISNQWNNIVVTFDGISISDISSFKLYINGAKISISTRGHFGRNNTGSINIGRMFNSIYYNGKIDHVALFDYALSDGGVSVGQIAGGQIAELYGNSTDGVGNPMLLSTKPVAYYKIGDKAAFNGSEYLVTNSASEVYSPYALDFDGASANYITTTSSLSGLSSFTLSAWANPETLTNADTLLGQWRNSNTNNSLLLMYLISNSIEFYVGDGGTARLAGGDTTLSTGQWYHFCGTFDGTTIKLYVNGVQEPTTATVSSINTTTVNLSIGAYNNNGGTGFENTKTWNGKISNVSIWNAALTSTQVTEIYNSGKPGNLNTHSAYSNLVSWWQLGENSSFNTNWTVLDEKGTNNGTSVNMSEDAIVNGVGTSANGLSDGMGGADNIIGDAPYSTANAVSYGMGVDAKSTSVPS